MTLTHVLQLSNDVTTISLADGNPVSIRGPYIPRTSQRGENVTETFEILIEETTGTGGQTKIEMALQKIQDINKLLVEAEQWEKNRNGRRRVWVYLDPGDIGKDRRARVIEGTCDAVETTTGLQLENGKLIASITWTRTIYEAKTPTQLRLEGYGSSTTSEEIVNAMVGGKSPSAGNYLEMGGTLLAGDFYAPVKISLQNTSGTAITQCWVGSVTDKVAQFTYNTKDSGLFFEAEAAAEYGDGGGTATADASCSGGTYVNFGWTNASEVYLAGWNLTGSEANYFGGGKYAIMARMAGTVIPDDLYVRFKFGTQVTSGGVTIYKPDWTGDLIKVPQSTEIFLVDTAYLPPNIPLGTSGTIGPKSIWMHGFKNDGSAVVFNLDFFDLFPISPESELNYMRSVNGAGVAATEYLTMDWINQSVYRSDGTLLYMEFMQEQGKGVYLTPGANTRVYFHVQGAGTADPFRASEVQIWYSPRYRTI